MSVTGRIRPRHGFYAVGAASFGLGVAHLLTEGEGLGTVLESFITCSLAASVCYTGYELRGRTVSVSGQWRALLSSVSVAVSFALLAFAVWLTWHIEGGSTEFSFLITFATALGAAVGARAGLYAAQSREQLAHAQQLSKLLTVNQRVLRHNLRNELSVALGHLENVEAADDVADVADDVAVIRDHLNRLLETSDRARRIVSIWETDERTVFDLSSLVEEQVANARERHPEATVTTDVPDECRVVAHSALPLALSEALTNALEHNPADVAVAVTVTPNPDDTVTVDVTDTGRGIPPFDRAAIGRPEETQLSHVEGLGLWIIYWTVEMSDGTLTFDENDPRGTVVRMTLPTSERSRPFAPW